MSADDFLSIGQTEERYQLREGVVHRMPRPTMIHQEFVALMVEMLLEHRRRGLSVFYQEIDWRLGAGKVYVPDLVCFRADRAPVRGSFLAECPDLIVEVLSPSAMLFDLVAKRDDYETAGVPEYWAIDPTSARLRCYRRQEGQLVEVPVTGDVVESAALPGFVLELAPFRRLAAAKVEPPA